MLEVTPKRNFIIFKNTELHLKYAIWLVEIMTQYENTKFIQSSLEHGYPILHAIA